MRGNYCVSSGKCVPLAHCSCPFPQPENKTTKKIFRKPGLDATYAYCWQGLLKSQLGCQLVNNIIQGWSPVFQEVVFVLN